MADMPDLESGGLTPRAGSTPVAPTTYMIILDGKNDRCFICDHKYCCESFYDYESGTVEILCHWCKDRTCNFLPYETTQVDTLLYLSNFHRKCPSPIFGFYKMLSALVGMWSNGRK